MNFSSPDFLLRFLPVFLIVYYLAGPKLRNAVLFCGSAAFYMISGSRYVMIMIMLLIINYLATDRMYSTESYTRIGLPVEVRRELHLLMAVGCNLVVLFCFKYFGTTMTLVSHFTGKTSATENLILPLGLSFFTFQMIAYDIDVYKRRYKKRPDFLMFLNFAIMFPYVSSGPIVRYGDVESDIKTREITARHLEKGAVSFICGLAMKVLLADNLATVWSEIWRRGPLGIDLPSAWFGAWGYSLRLYFDFAGYSLMAIGIGSMLGFSLPDNFDHPYAAVSMTDFWRRWHITLGRWFRDYIYIPLGGSRRGMPVTILNLLIVWCLTAVWHDASLHFLLWGGFIFVLLVLEKTFLHKIFDRVRLLGHLYMMIAIPLSWLIFNVSDITVLVEYVRRMFDPAMAGVVTEGLDLFRYMISQYGVLMAVGAIFATPAPAHLIRKYHDKLPIRIVLCILFIVSVYVMMTGQDNPFMYFSF
ncbi:MAG: MBOAT family protein [Lachnospiraceae bacterium]|nr:MBOAT family protein [Lachnospiraceae bacterium]